ncbi:hypothetical protein GCM10009641_59740 [Mycobacterium cookii]|uniref:Uncharacterized protein n=1 Tax=Nocardioides furvisabuli TaxID=375542 RepID=A0ABN2X7P0_9ACTN
MVMSSTVVTRPRATNRPKGCRASLGDMAPTIATNTDVGLEELLDFGSPQASPVAGGFAPEVAG